MGEVPLYTARVLGVKVQQEETLRMGTRMTLAVRRRSGSGFSVWG